MCVRVCDLPGSLAPTLREDSSVRPLVSFPRRTASQTVSLEPAQPSLGTAEWLAEPRAGGPQDANVLGTRGSPCRRVSPENPSHPIPSCPRTFVHNPLPKTTQDLPGITLPGKPAPAAAPGWEFTRPSPANRTEAHHLNELPTTAV